MLVEALRKFMPLTPLVMTMVLAPVVYELSNIGTTQ